MIPDGKTEEDTDHDGFLSYSAEWHSFVHGFYDGMRTVKPVTRKLPDNDDVQKEPAYYKGAFVIATFLQLGLAVGFSYGILL